MGKRDACTSIIALNSPTIHRFNVEAIQEGDHLKEKLTSRGLPWINRRNPYQLNPADGE